jgi:hypothetical protein
MEANVKKIDVMRPASHLPPQCDRRVMLYLALGKISMGVLAGALVCFGFYFLMFAFIKIFLICIV